ncbi:MAG TPA: sulfotransferase, partial [Mizugakiibacter sp.]
TALSVWSQMFGNPEYGFACDFADIALVAADCERLMAHWQSTLPLAIHVLDYEYLATKPQETLDALGAFVGLPTFDLLAAPAPDGAAIASASLWQARQPVHRGSIGRWRRYAPYLPELTAAFPD